METAPEQDIELQPVTPNEQIQVETVNSAATLKPMTM